MHKHVCTHQSTPTHPPVHKCRRNHHASHGSITHTDLVNTELCLKYVWRTEYWKWVLSRAINSGHDLWCIIVWKTTTTADISNWRKEVTYLCPLEMFHLLSKGRGCLQCWKVTNGTLIDAPVKRVIRISITKYTEICFTWFGQCN